MTHDTPIRVEHVGIAVEEFEEAEAVLHALGARQYVDDTGPNDDFRWAGYLLGDASRLELVTPLSDDNFIRDFLDRHGPGLHHVTLEVENMDAVIAALEAADVTVVDRAQHETYEEAFVSPANPTGALFQLMRYREGYVEKYDSPDTYVNGMAVANAFDDRN
ncbi:VOC family protein [Halorubellus sp. JP-L1]|uniref:VOC family protein n=1 Tax=Halorubellus sp. JP-L1 TaxID=2715753 RepID=UPI0014089356|nr:VOC family protein [Halorubellus sp. JP-L1]